MELAEPTQRMIVESGLSVSELSRLTRAKYGAESCYFIADTFISTIRKGVSPHLCQIAALSEFTRHSFVDLMRHFGFDLRQLTWLQMKLHAHPTVLITPYESFTAPSQQESRYLYARIGQRDGMAFPEIMPGSIVRIDTNQTSVPATSWSDGQPPLYIVDHLGGLNCCYVTALNDSEILLTPRYLPYPCRQYHLGEQARILGVVDAELRPLQGIKVPNPAVFRKFQRRVPVPAIEGSQTISELLRSSRERVGLRFREACDLASLVAGELKNDAYGIALGTLSDYEAVDVVPRSVAKIISLCAVYGIDFRRYLRSAGITLNPPDMTASSKSASVGYSSPSLAHESEVEKSRSSITQICFPRSLVDAQSRLHECKSNALETYLVRTGSRCDRTSSTDAKSFLVDPYSTQLSRDAWLAPWQRPQYVVRRCDGTYVYGFCTVTEGILTVHHDPTMNRVVERFYRDEVDVVGQVVGMLRSVGQKRDAV